MEKNIRTIAIYLPQYHEIPENNEWWGKGFTEWTNTSKAKPLFDGHYQPHIPSKLGYYNLLDDDVQVKQAELAKEHKIDGFCYYHYWFNGKQLLETPINNLLKSGKPDFPFCLCWANENWTRRWDGLDSEILMPQNHNFEDDKNFIQSLIPFFKDKRYITIDDKPLLIIYRTELFPDIKKTSEIWREEVQKAGFKDIYLVRVEGFIRNIDPYSIGFDAAMEFAPDFHEVGTDLNENGKLFKNLPDLKIYDYKFMASNMMKKRKPNYTIFRSVTPSWDNTPRKGKNGTVLINSSPDYYKKWLDFTLDYTYINNKDDERILFINAWNEWGEGNHLEPDKKHENKYLEITKSSLNESKERMYNLQLAENLIERNMFDEAKNILLQILEKSPLNIQALNDLSVLSILTENIEEALDYLQKVLEIDPVNEIANGNLEFLSQKIESAINIK